MTNLNNMVYLKGGDKLKKWTEKDVDRFDKLISMCESKNQQTRIVGRYDFKRFEEKFTKKEMKEMWKIVKNM